MSTTGKLVSLAKLSLENPESSHWLELAGVLRTCTASKKEASALLKQTWGSSDNSHYRSKISGLAHPVDRVAFEKARKAKVGVNNLIPLSSGKSVFDGENVVRKFTDSRGGWNRKSPQDRLEASLIKAFAQAENSQVRRDTAKRIALRTLANTYPSKKA